LHCDELDTVRAGGLCVIKVRHYYYDEVISKVLDVVLIELWIGALDAVVMPHCF